MDLALARAHDAATPDNDISNAGVTADRGTEECLALLFSGQQLNRQQMHGLIDDLVEGQLSEPLTAAMLVSLRLRGETEEEMIGAALSLRRAASSFPRPDYLFADTCGTGGDNSASINVSTAVAFVCASAGLPVAKHGNRSFTSRCGSADVLEAFGARLDIGPDRSRAILDEIGFCFLFAPAYHPGLRHAGPARRAIKVRTLMNALGPCLNPARPSVQLLGVAEPSLLRKVANVLVALGVERALVVHGAGLDEIALHDETQAIRIVDGAIEPITLSPRDAGIPCFPASALRGGDASENARRLQDVLSGRGRAADTHAVAINAGALLMTAGLTPDLAAGVARARAELESGAPGEILSAYVEASRA
ncbi:MAG: anthranilate phosphoribosyltransferase [Hyphomonadaceae bacterium]